MYRFATIAAFIFALPLISVAQTSGPDSGSVQGLAAGLLLLINNYLIPFLISLAVLFFIYNVVRYFILQSHDVEGRAAARQLALWGITALAFIMAFWGIIYFVIQGFGLDNAISEHCRPVPDFINPLGYECDGGSAENPHDGIGGVPYDPTDNPHEGVGGAGNGNDTQPTDNDAEHTTPLQPGMGGDADSEDFDSPADSSPSSTTIEDDARLLTSDFFNGGMQRLRLGEANAAALLEDGYFADLYIDGQGNFNDLERLQAMYRLNQLGEVDTNTMDRYLNAINEEREEAGLSPISASEVANSIAIDTSDQPQFIADERSEIGQEVREGLEAHNQRTIRNELSETQIDNLVNNVTDPTASYAIRRQRMQAMLGDNPQGIEYLQIGESADREPNYELKQKLYDQLNTERMYDGDFSEFF